MFGRRLLEAQLSRKYVVIATDHRGWRRWFEGFGGKLVHDAVHFRKRDDSVAYVAQGFNADKLW